MKTNIFKTGIALIIAIACSYAAFCHSDGCQNPSSVKSPSQVQLGKENNAFCNADALQNPSSVKSPSQVQLGGENNAFCHSDGCQNPSSVKSPSQVQHGKEKNAFCHSDGCQNPSSKKSPSQVQLGGENNAFCHSDGCQNPSSNINQRVNPLVDKKDKPQDSDSGWVQKDGYLENALQVGSISYFRYSNDGQYLFTFGSDYTFRKWDVKTGKVVKEKWFDYEHIYSFDLHSDEKTMAIIVEEDFWLSSTIYIYQNDTISTFFDSYNIYKPPDYCNLLNALLCFIKDKPFLYINFDVSCFSSEEVNTTSGSLWWNLQSNQLDTIDYYSANATNLLASGNGNYLCYSAYYYHSDWEGASKYKCLLLFDLDKSNKMYIIDESTEQSFNFLGFSHSNKYLASTKQDSYTLVWDIDNQKTKYRIFIPNLMNNKFSADNRFLITTLEKPDTSIIKFFLAETGVEADSIYFASKSHNGIIAVAPDSVNIAIAGQDGIIRIFQPKIFTETYKTYFAADSINKQLSNPIKFSDYSLPNAKSWKWDFGDGTKSYEQNPVHYYKNKGFYTVKLITSNGIQTDTMVKKDYIRMHNPVIADFDTYISQDTVPFKVIFNNYSQGDIISYKWDCGIKKTSIQENPSFIYDKWGKYDISLTVTDGCFTSKKEINNYIIAIPPTIPFFINKYENLDKDEFCNVYGLCGIETMEGDFVYLGKVLDTSEYIFYKYSFFNRIDKKGRNVWSHKIVKDFKDIVQTNDSCFLLLNTMAIDYYTHCFLVTKYNKFGDSLWEKSYPVKGNDYVDKITLTPDNGFIVIGKQDYNTQLKTPVLKADKDGNKVWYKIFNGCGGDVLNTKDGNYLLILMDIKNVDIILNKIDSLGNILWTKQYGTDKNMLSYDALALKKEEFVIAGGIGNNGINTTYFLKVDSLGEKIWEYIGESPNSCYYSISSISDTLFAATGNFNNQLGIDIINNQGELVNSVRFPERSGAINSIVTTKDNDLFLTGSITPPYKLSQLYTLLLKHPYIITSVEDKQTENIANPEQPFSIFPNPTNSNATLKYKIETPTHLKIELIDFMGMKVSEVENAFKEAGEYNTLINFENLAIAKGIYFVRFIANGNVFVSKVIFY